MMVTVVIRKDMIMIRIIISVISYLDAHSDLARYRVNDQHNHHHHYHHHHQLRCHQKGQRHGSHRRSYNKVLIAARHANRHASHEQHHPRRSRARYLHPGEVHEAPLTTEWEELLCRWQNKSPDEGSPSRAILPHVWHFFCWCR